MLTNEFKNEIFLILSERNISLNILQYLEDSNSFLIRFWRRPFLFRITQQSKIFGKGYTLKITPEDEFSRPVQLNWEGVLNNFRRWTDTIQKDLNTPDLWAEAAKTAQLFTGTTEAPDDKFTRTELAEVQGQLRQLQQSFTAAALPEAARQKLIELTQTAAVKAEGFTKKDWQGWFIGSLIGKITEMALDAIQVQEVVKLVKAAFGGLFLH